eukprot:2074610-Amphidinium_carterae.2
MAISQVNITLSISILQEKARVSSPLARCRHNDGPARHSAISEQWSRLRLVESRPTHHKGNLCHHGHSQQSRRGQLLQDQKWSLMDDSGAVSVAPLSFASHVLWQPVRGDQKLQSVTDAEIKVHGFKKCIIMSGGIGLRVNFTICDVSCPIIGNSTMEEN